VRLRALAVLMLLASSNFVGCSTRGPPDLQATLMVNARRRGRSLKASRLQPVPTLFACLRVAGSSARVTRA
jgi:hypothetical protein